MAYRLKLKEDLSDGVRRVAVDQLAKVLRPLASPEDRSIWVHEARKALKRTRALLRLVRSSLKPATWDAENADLRDIARSLSPMRDHDILRMVMAQLAVDGDAMMVAALGRMAASLDASWQDTVPRQSGTVELLAEVRKQVAAARDRLTEISLDGELADVISTGIAKGQRRGSEALARVEADPSAENLHELRKAVQTYWRQMVLVQPAWPDVLAARAASARQLAQLLGEVQDLAVLAAAVTSNGGSGAARRRDVAAIVAACQRGQEARQAVAIPSAARLFAASPKSAGLEIATCWQASMSVSAEAARLRKATSSPQSHAVRHPRNSRRIA